MSWPTVPLGDVVKFIGGAQPPKDQFIYKEAEGYIRLLQIRDYKSSQNLTYIPANKARRFCNESDVMIGRYGPPVFQILRGLEGSYNVALMKAEPSKKVDNDYLYYFLKQEKLFLLIDRLSQRTAGQSGVDMDALKSFPMLLPPISEQKRIAATLDKADAIRHKRQQAIELADEFLRSVFLDMFGDPVVNPKRWESLTLGTCAKLINGDRSSNYPSGDDLLDHGILFLNTKNIREGKIDLRDTKFISTEKFHSLGNGKLEPDDLVITLRGTLGNCAKFSCGYETGFINAQLMIIRLDNSLNPDFVHAILTSRGFQHELQRMGNGAAVPQLTATQMKSLMIISPPKSLQNKYVEIRSKVNNILSKMNPDNDESMFNSLSQKAFAGEL